MPITTISLSFIASVRYDAEPQILEVEFLNKSVYRYLQRISTLVRYSLKGLVCVAAPLRVPLHKLSGSSYGCNPL
ncbi:MAG TPA: hypothetical protein DDW76_13995 [Cyanobacteria bacterium UBA11369]|nr:hypothetical protein [Cyanobacteria bacterium UBA11371]HBE49868.1 hypothetical protein [Cyanobacteria bacterium UBA11369]